MIKNTNRCKLEGYELAHAAKDVILREYVGASSI